MTDVMVAFDVPVYAVVDTESGEIKSVHVADDEAMQHNVRWVVDSVDSEDRPLEAERFDKAVTILNDPAVDWPAWSWGF